jgi:hypothetical protein
MKQITRYKKKMKVWHFVGIFGPVCMLNNKGYLSAKSVKKSLRLKKTIIKSKVTCKKCKKTPQFLIHDYERRFLGKTL